MSEEKNEEVEILDEYDFSNAVIGKYAKQYAEGTNIVVLEPDVAEVFPDSAAVNQALRQLIEQRSREFHAGVLGTANLQRSQVAEVRDSALRPPRFVCALLFRRTCLLRGSDRSDRDDLKHARN